MSKYGIFSGPYFPVLRPNTEKDGQKQFRTEHFSRSVMRKEPNSKFYGVFDHFLRTHEVKMV